MEFRVCCIIIIILAKACPADVVSRSNQTVKQGVFHCMVTAMLLGATTAPFSEIFSIAL